MTKTSPIPSRDKLGYRRYYASGNDLMKLNIQLIETISKYAMSQTDPQVSKEVMDVINHITTVTKAEEILKYVIMYEFTDQETFNFLIKSITTVYN